MTVIAAYGLPDRVIMGCDTATDHGGTVVYGSRGKIGVIEAGDGERVLIAAAGNASAGRLIERNLTIDSTPDDPADEDGADKWAGTIAEAITDIFACASPPLIISHSDNADTLDANMLLAWRQHLWVVFTHAAIRPADGILAIGSGRDIALGALYTSRRNGVDEPSEAVSYAVRLASTYDQGCRIDDRGPILHSTVVG